MPKVSGKGRMWTQEAYLQTFTLTAKLHSQMSSFSVPDILPLLPTPRKGTGKKSDERDLREQLLRAPESLLPPLVDSQTACGAVSGCRGRKRSAGWVQPGSEAARTVRYRVPSCATPDLSQPVSQVDNKKNIHLGPGRCGSTGHRPTNWKATDSISGQVTWIGCRFCPCRGEYERQQVDVSLPLVLPPFPSL